MATRAFRAFLVLSLVYVALGAIPILAEEPATPKAPESAPEGEKAAIPASPAEGAARRTPLEGTDLARMLRRDMNLVAHNTPDGMSFIEVPEGFRSVFIARMGPDGKPVVSCVISEAQAEAFFNDAESGVKDKTP